MYLPGWVGVGVLVCLWVGFGLTMIRMQIAVEIALNLNWSTGSEFGKIMTELVAFDNLTTANCNATIRAIKMHICINEGIVIHILERI